MGTEEQSESPIVDTKPSVDALLAASKTGVIGSALPLPPDVKLLLVPYGTGYGIVGAFDSVEAALADRHAIPGEAKVLAIPGAYFAE